MIDGVHNSAPAARIDAARVQLDKGSPVARAGDALARDKAGNAGAAIADMAAGGPPVDGDKVARIRAAIAEGRYPVDADRIAERMIALDLPARA